MTGWVIDEAQPDARVEVQLYIDGRVAASARADRERRDVYEAGRAADERHGFSFDTPAALRPGEHEARVYAAHESDEGARRTLQLIGRPLSFRVEADESVETRDVRGSRAVQQDLRAVSGDGDISKREGERR